MPNPYQKYPLSPEFRAELERRFTHHPPKDDQVVRYESIRGLVHNVAVAFVQRVPEGRELDIALQKLEEAVMAANAGIARRE